MEMEEIVRYMSKLPSYLERGKIFQDRALNFGVLDWGRLEQWQYHHHHYHHLHHHHKEGVTKTNKYSPSGSISSNRSSLWSHLNISQDEISTKDALVNHSSEKKTTNLTRNKIRCCIKNDFHSQNLPEPKSSVDTGNFQTTSSSASLSSSSSKGKMKIQDELINEIGNFQDSPYGHKALVLNGKKPEEIHSDSKNDVPNLFPFHNKTINKKTSDRRHRLGFSFSMNCKSEDTKSATKTVKLLPVYQNSPEDSKIKEKVKMDLRNCKEVRVADSCMNNMNYSSSSSLSLSSSSRKQARFQMAVKNGHPSFTFAVDDENKDIVTATIRSLTVKDDTNSWIYTFFTVNKDKKTKGNWLYHDMKDKVHGYLPNVTAQMKVSNPSFINCTTREFVLSSVHSGQPEQQILDIQLDKELAAIVVKFPIQEDEDCFNMTVILPGGHHSVPRKGEPSSLIERWRSGGRCDCDGWDVGCRLRTLANNAQSNRTSNPPESFHLYLQPQEDVINEMPIFSLSSINKGEFSADYDSSLPLLHAFSICISVIECRQSCRDTNLRTYDAKQVDDDVAHVAYASLPPVSLSFGRV